MRQQSWLTTGGNSSGGTNRINGLPAAGAAAGGESAWSNGNYEPWQQA